MSRKGIVFLIVSAVSLVSLMIIATAFDYQISLALSTLNLGDYYSNNFFCVFFEIFGELPVYLVCTFALTVLFYSIDRLFKDKIVIILKLILLLLAFSLNVVCFDRIYKYIRLYFDVHLNKTVVLFYGFIYSLAICFLTLFLTQKINKITIKSLAVWALIAIVAIILSQIFVHFMKPIFARVRFRTINVLNDEQLFSAWFKLSVLSEETKNLIISVIGSDGFKSFPSGHTASSASLLTLLLLPQFCDYFKVKIRKVVLNCTAIIFVLLVALSRIMIGAHYLSDVVFAIILTSLLLLLSYFVVLKIVNRINYKHSQKVASNIKS